MAGAGSVDGGGHDDVGFYVGGEAGADDGDVGGSLGVGGLRFAVLEVGVEGWGGVDEGLGVMIGVGDGLVGEVGSAGCLVWVGSVSVL